MAASYRLSKAELKVAEDEATAKANEAHELGSDLWQESYDGPSEGPPSGSRRISTAGGSAAALVAPLAVLTLTAAAARPPRQACQPCRPLGLGRLRSTQTSPTWLMWRPQCR